MRLWLRPTIETPPRTWRRRSRGHFRYLACGNTSTDVEKTSIIAGAVGEHQKHLHGRGEDESLPGVMSRPIETPPRTWRRRDRGRQGELHPGNTSTDVEKTKQWRPGLKALGKHLHGRGEDILWDRIDDLPGRNTSTDVEKTRASDAPSCPLEKHLHGRGEDRLPFRSGNRIRETPPRTWRRL